MTDYIIFAVIVLILGGAIWYVIKAKKSGKKCIGCPDGCCSNTKECCACSCGCDAEKKD